MGIASINFIQNGTGPGPGYAMLGVVDDDVTVSNADDGGIVQWTYEIVDVGPGSTVSTGIVQSGATPTYTFTPDVTGCYVAHLTTMDRQGNLAEDFRVFGVVEPNGLLIPSFEADAASMNFVVDAVTNTKGWSPAMQAWLKLVEASSGPAVSIKIDHTVSFTFPSGISSEVVLNDTSLGHWSVTLDPSPVDGQTAEIKFGPACNFVGSTSGSTLTLTCAGIGSGVHCEYEPGTAMSTTTQAINYLTYLKLQWCAAVSSWFCKAFFQSD
jgi:hypothetical protein